MLKKLVGTVLLLWFAPACASAAAYVVPGEFIGNPSIISFWEASCAECDKQLPILASFARSNPRTNVIVVSVGSNGAKQKLKGTQPNNLGFRSVTDSEQSLRAFGGNLTTMPFTVLLREDSSICESHAGVQAQPILEHWKKECLK